MKKVFIMLVVSSLALAGFAGCSAPAEKPAAPAEGTPAAAPPAAPASDAGGATDKAGIVKLMGDASQFIQQGLSYEMVMGGAEGAAAVTNKMTMKGNKVRMENPQMVMIIDGDNSVMYMPASKMGFKFKTGGKSPAGTPTPDAHPEKSLDQNSITYGGKEDLNGEPCITFTSKNTTGSQVKGWIHAKYGIIMKMEIKDEKGTVSTIETKNLKVGGVDDGVFTVPSDIKFVEMPTGQ